MSHRPKSRESGKPAIIAVRRRDGRRRRLLRIEPLEPRWLLDGRSVDPHGFFLGEVFPLPIEPSVFATADFNRDGVPDLLGGEPTSNTIAVLLGNGDGTFAPRLTSAATNAYEAVIADLNNDNFPDVVVANPGRRDIRHTHRVSSDQAGSEGGRRRLGGRPIWETGRPGP